jgi:transcriptional regulator with XRE-family HTH domain
MADRVTGPLGPRRHIAAALKQLREDSGKLLSDVAGDLMISTSKLSRLENAQGRPLPRDIRDLIRYYGIQRTPLADRLQEWVKVAQLRGWWTEYDDRVLEKRLDAHLAYEADATLERTYTLPFVPALLQTEDYARAVFRDMEKRSEEEIRQLLEVRQSRRRALTERNGLPPLELVAVTYESTLRQWVGSPQILADQLDALAEHSQAPNIRLHVLPFDAGPVFGMTCMWAYFEYQGVGDLEQDVVHIETPAGWWSIEDPAMVAYYRRAHDALVEASLNEDDSRSLILALREERQSG